jgi:PAS domain S-box-containing protein
MAGRVHAPSLPPAPGTVKARARRLSVGGGWAMLTRMDAFERLRACSAGLVAAVTAGADPFVASALRAVPSDIVVATPDGKIAMVLRQGQVVERAIGVQLFDFLAPADAEEARARVARVVATGEPATHEAQARTGSGRVTHYQATIAPVRDGDEVLGVVCVVVDVTRYVRDQHALRDSEEKLRLAVEGSGMGLWSWEVAGDRVVWDRRLCDIFGVAAGPRDFDEYRRLIHPDDWESLQANIGRALETGVYDPIEHRLIHADGSVRWIFARASVVRGADGKVIRLIGGVLDVTERRRLQEQLMVAQKMEAVGQLTAGIAHNFNNMLMAILPTLELVHDHLGEPWRGLVGDAQHAGRRAAEMVRQLMTFAGAGANADGRAAEPAAKMVDRAVSMCRELFPRHIGIVVRDASAAAHVRADGGQVEQALVNILLNARDAVVDAHHESSTIEVELDVVSADEVRAHAVRAGAAAAAAENAYLRARVRDHGVGMPENVRARIFEPFFSTKGVGRGTGLGLATTYAIARDHGGFVRCESAPGRGTTMELYLPVVAPGGPRRIRTSKPPGPGRERVLVVDDEPTVRRVVAYILGDAGYQVVEAADGAEALATLERDPHIGLVLLDRSMPGLRGESVLRRIRERAPAMPVIYFTGQQGAVGAGERADATVAKPITTDALLRTVRSVLDRQS